MKLFKNEADKAFYRRIFALVAPIVVQNLLSAAVGSADVVMLNYVGQSAISAVSLAANYTNILFMVYYGLGTGATMLCAQYYGKGEYEPIRVVQGLAMRFSLIISLVFAALALFAPEGMMRVFTDDVELIRLGAVYMRYMSVTYLCWSILEIYLSVLRSIGQVRISMVLNVMAFALNIILNAVFIFGWFGAPKMGVAGVALATLLSRLIELICCFAVSLTQKEIRLDFGYMLRRNKLLQHDFIRMSLPAMGNDVIWGLAFSMYSVIMGHLGSDVVAANSLVTVVRNFGTTFAFGIASGGTILLGNIIGSGDMEGAKICASKLIRLTVASGALGGLLVLAVSPFVLEFASLTETAHGYLRGMLLINSYYVMGAAVNTMLIAGVFRAGGDSRFGFICDTIDMWLYAVPLGFIAAFVLKLPVMAVYFLLCTDEFVKWPWVIGHYRSMKWLKNITRDDLFAGAEAKR
ncbi:MAG: MATE family efflux transporter [Clostridia bacterium]|nr:MATE family efflux transporter [Clostridia bacterium]